MKEPVHLVHANGNHRIIKVGFCWPGFLLPGLWAMSEGLWRPFAFSSLFFNLIALFSDVAENSQRRSLSDITTLSDQAAALSATAYFLMMLCCGLFGKKWLVGRWLKHGYVEYRSLPAQKHGPVGRSREVAYLPPAGSTTCKNADVEQAGLDDTDAA